MRRTKERRVHDLTKFGLFVIAHRLRIGILSDVAYRNRRYVSSLQYVGTHDPTRRTMMPLLTPAPSFSIGLSASASCSTLRASNEALGGRCRRVYVQPPDFMCRSGFVCKAATAYCFGVQ
jgi:hypothetical protein